MCITLTVTKDKSGRHKTIKNQLNNNYTSHTVSQLTLALHNYLPVSQPIYNLDLSTGVKLKQTPSTEEQELWSFMNVHNHAP